MIKFRNMEFNNYNELTNYFYKLLTAAGCSKWKEIGVASFQQAMLTEEGLEKVYKAIQTKTASRKPAEPARIKLYTQTNENMITEAQYAYLQKLIMRHPAYRMSNEELRSMTKYQASVMIDEITDFE